MPWVPLVQQDLKVFQVRQGLLVSPVNLVKMGVRVQLGDLVVLELPVRLVVQVPLVEVELVASKDHQDQLEQLVRLVVLDSLEVLVQ